MKSLNVNIVVPRLRRIVKWFGLFVILLVSFILLPTLATMQSKTLTADSTVESLRQESFDNLIKSAEQTGKVRVIVGVRVDFNIGDESYLQNIEARKEDIKTAQDKFTNQLSAYNLNPLKYTYIPYLAMTVDADALREMKNLPDVVSIEKDEMLQPSLAESVPMIGGIASWNAGYTANGQTIAIIDSGVDKTHPMLQGKIVSEACYSGYDNTNAFATCSGNFGPNPYPEPSAPFMVSSTAVDSGLPCNLSITSDCAHGTHVAGIAAGRTTNFAGVARDAGVIAINASSFVPVNGGYKVNFYNSALLLALERVFELRTSFNIASVNMSIGSPNNVYTNTTQCDSFSPSIKTAIDNLRAVGIATVISSGNGDMNLNGYINAISFPACISSAISVGSVNDGSPSGVYNGAPTIADRVSPFSNSASFLNLLAPGDGITSSVPSLVSQTGYANYGGTSQAAPHVAGAWAVLKQRNPNASVTQVLNTLSNTGIPILDSRNNITKPRIRVDYALSVIGATCVITPISIGQTLNGQSLSASDCSFSDSLNRYFDYYTFNATAGQQISISMNSTFDTYLSLRNSTGQILLEDNNGGGGTNSRIPAISGFYTIPATGTYTILATSNPNNTSGIYNLNLSGNCSFSIGQMTQNFAATGGNGSINVTGSPGCAWTAFSNAGWISITSGSSGTGNGTVNFSVGANTGAARTGTITAAGQTFTVTQNAGTTVVTSKPFDFDGDGKTDVSIFRPSVGEWWINRSSTNQTIAAQFGQSTDKIVPGDFTGDGKTDIAFFRPSTGYWFILRSEDGSFFSFPFGTNGDIPAPADYDGDGKADAAVFRPSNSTWFILGSAGNTIIQQFGISGDVPVTADYDGDGKSDIAIYRPSVGEWWINRSSAGILAFQFGSSTDKPVQGDYTGDGKADAAFFRPSTGFWFVLRSEDFSFFSAPFGTPGDIPAPGDYDGDGKFDFGIFRPSNSTWFVQRSTAGTAIQQFGASGDKPVPNAFVP